MIDKTNSGLVRLAFYRKKQGVKIGFQPYRF